MTSRESGYKYDSSPPSGDGFEVHVGGSARSPSPREIQLRALQQHLKERRSRQGGDTTAGIPAMASGEYESIDYGRGNASVVPGLPLAEGFHTPPRRVGTGEQRAVHEALEDALGIAPPQSNDPIHLGSFGQRATEPTLPGLPGIFSGQTPPQGVDVLVHPAQAELLEREKRIAASGKSPRTEVNMSEVRKAVTAQASPNMGMAREDAQAIRKDLAEEFGPDWEADIAEDPPDSDEIWEDVDLSDEPETPPLNPTDTTEVGPGYQRIVHESASALAVPKKNPSVPERQVLKGLFRDSPPPKDETSTLLDLLAEFATEELKSNPTRSRSDIVDSYWEEYQEGLVARGITKDALKERFSHLSPEQLTPIVETVLPPPETPLLDPQEIGLEKIESLNASSKSPEPVETRGASYRFAADSSKAWDKLKDRLQKDIHTSLIQSLASNRGLVLKPGANIIEIAAASLPFTQRVKNWFFGRPPSFEQVKKTREQLVDLYEAYLDGTTKPRPKKTTS